MDIATGLGLLFGCAVVGLVIMMGGDLQMFVSEHAFIVIFGGSFAATLIRFPAWLNFSRATARRQVRFHTAAHEPARIG
jgi:flagellar motor component MotA